MTTHPASAADDATALRAVRLTRGITATWWYTFGALVFFELMLVFVWATTLLVHGVDDPTLAIVGIGGLVWTASTVPLLLDYRHRVDGALLVHWRRIAVPLAVALGFGIAAGLATGVWMIAALPVVQSLALLNWQPGIRLRLVAVGTLLLIGLWIVDANVPSHPHLDFGGPANWWLLSFYTTFLPAMSVLSLWWWDVLVALDRARASEARLAATQERLRVATDVHDLQGHHLQVVALQLELAERLLSRDPEAAREQLLAARASVDEARQGTRDLATRFRSVPLPDELANAADLLRAAGTPTEVSVDLDADRAPADVLGPVIRETTTNVLRHGAGSWARLALTREGSTWRYEIANDVSDEAESSADGSGLDGLARRAADAGGKLDVRRGDGVFSVAITVPAQPADAR